MLPTRKTAVWLFLVIERVLTTQIPLSPHHPPLGFDSGLGHANNQQWDLDEPLFVNATGNLVFETANSLLQHWANTRYRNGHTIVPGTVPVGTILYHGAITGPNIPVALDWVATEPDHSMLFCLGTDKSGCWHITFAVTRPMKVLYFDGSSAALMSEGTMDTQDLLAWSEMKPEWALNEYQRIEDLCKWGEKHGVDGFVRMQMNFEMMVCNFTSHMEVVSSLNLETLHLKLKGGQPTEDQNTMHSTFELMHSASWRETHPGETHIILDYSGFISFYDTTLVPSLVSSRVGLERWDHRVASISPDDMERVKDRLAQELERSPVIASGIDWKMVMRLVVDRYASRLDVMRYLLNITLDDTHILLDHAEKVQRQLRTLLAPYTVLAAVPSDTSVTCDTTNPWAAPVFRECVKSHTSSLSAHGTRLTPSEHLLLEAVQETTREICRVTTRMWASGLTAGVDPFYPADQRPEADRIRPLMDEWKKDLTKLMSWLDWSVWVKCRPACGIEEMCYLPTWPIGFFPPPYDLPEPEGHPSSSQARENAMLPDPNKGEWKRPEPKCIRRLAPYGF